MHCKLLPLTWQDFGDAIDVLMTYIEPGTVGVFGEPRGGLTLAVALSHRSGLPYLRFPRDGMVWVDDIIHSGKTLEQRKAHFPGAQYLAWVGRGKRKDSDVARIVRNHWVVFPWEDRNRAMEDRLNHLLRKA